MPMQIIVVVELRFDGLHGLLPSPESRGSSNRAPTRCSGWGRRPPRRQEAEVQRRLESISGEPRGRSYRPRAHEWQENKLNDVVGLCYSRQLFLGLGVIRCQRHYTHSILVNTPYDAVRHPSLPRWCHPSAHGYPHRRIDVHLADKAKIVPNALCRLSPHHMPGKTHCSSRLVQHIIPTRSCR